MKGWATLNDALVFVILVIYIIVKFIWVNEPGLKRFLFYLFFCILTPCFWFWSFEKKDAHAWLTQTPMLTTVL